MVNVFETIKLKIEKFVLVVDYGMLYIDFK